MCSRSSQEVYCLGNCQSDERCCQSHHRYTRNRSWARYWSCDKPEKRNNCQIKWIVLEFWIPDRVDCRSFHSLEFQQESICSGGSIESCKAICCASPDKVLKKNCPPRGERRLNCRDTTLPQSPPRQQRRCGVKRSFHIVRLYIKSRAAEREREAFV